MGITTGLFYRMRNIAAKPLRISNCFAGRLSQLKATFVKGKNEGDLLLFEHLRDEHFAGFNSVLTYESSAKYPKILKSENPLLTTWANWETQNSEFCSLELGKKAIVIKFNSKICPKDIKHSVCNIWFTMWCENILGNIKKTKWLVRAQGNICLMKEHNIRSKKDCSGMQRARERPFSFIRMNNYLLTKALLVPLASPLLQKSVRFCTYISLTCSHSEASTTACKDLLCKGTSVKQGVCILVWQQQNLINFYTEKALYLSIGKVTPGSKSAPQNTLYFTAETARCIY